MDPAQQGFSLDHLTAGDPSVYIGWAVFGLIAGVLAKFLLPGRDPGGILVTIGLGIAGAFVGNYLYGYLTGELVNMSNQFTLGGLFIAVLGGICLLLAYRVLFGGFRRAI